MTETPTLDDEMLDLLFRLTSDAPQKQLDAVDALDNKVLQLFAAGSVVVGLTAVGTSLKAAAIALPHGYYAAVLVAVAAYFALSAAAIVALWVRRFSVSWAADVTWDTYWNSSAHEIKHSLIESCARDYRRNRPILTRKRWLVRLASCALAAESLAVGSALLILLR